MVKAEASRRDMTVMILAIGVTEHNQLFIRGSGLTKADQGNAPRGSGTGTCRTLKPSHSP